MCEFDESKIKMVHWVINHIFPSYRGDEDFFQEACIGLLMAYKVYSDRLDVKFNTIAFPCIKNACYKEIRRRKKYKKFLCLSLNAKIEGTDDIELLEDIEDSNSNFENHIIDKVFTSELLDEIMRKCGGEKNKIFLKLLLEGKNYVEISYYMGISVHGLIKRKKALLKRINSIILTEV